MKKRIFGILFLTLSLLILTGGFWLGRQQQALADKMVRLHVVANSDTDEDQVLKLKVRDAVLEETQLILNGAADPRRALAEHLDCIETAANRCLRQEGSSDRAVVTMAKELFPTREYETFSLPAGTYTALRVTIGEGEGHNWWCVVFPSICMSASMDEFEEAAETAGLTEGEIKLITEESDGYVLKFKSIELLEKLKGMFSD